MELNNTEQIIEDNLELLQDIHAKNYTYTDGYFDALDDIIKIVELNETK